MLSNKVFTIGAKVLLLSLMLYLAMGLNQPALKEKPSYFPTTIPANMKSPAAKIMEICPICSARVDPDNSKYNIQLGGHYFYFDKESCLKIFAADPIKYSGAKVKFKVKIQSLPNPSTETQTLIPAPAETPQNGLEATPQENLTATPEPGATGTEELPIEEFPLEEETPKRN